MGGNVKQIDCAASGEVSVGAELTASVPVDTSVGVDVAFADAMRITGRR